MYIPTTWVNDGPPYINDTNLNKIEIGIKDAHDLAQAALDAGGSTVAGGTLDDRMAVLATPERFSGLDPTGVANSSSALSAAMTATPSGGTLWIPPGTYLMNSTVTVTNKSINVLAYGAKFVGNSLNAMFHFQGTYGTVYTATSAVSSQSTSYGHTTEQLYITTVTGLNANPNWKFGDIIKIAADDLIPEFDGTIRSGQFMMVIDSPTTTSVVLAGKLRLPFTTGIRLSKVPTAKVTWRGGLFRHSDAILTQTTMATTQFQYKYLIGPLIEDVVFESSAGPAFTTIGCFMWRHNNNSVYQALDRPSTMFGYGINCGGSEQGLVTNYIAVRVRHAFTTNGTSVGVGGTIGDFGRAYGNTIKDSKAFYTTQTAWDNHGDSAETNFDGCEVYDCYGAFGLRGINHRVTNSLISGPNRWGGISIPGGQSSSLRSYGHVINNVTYRNVTCELITASSTTSESNPSYVDNLYVYGRDTARLLISANNQPIRYGRIVGDSVGTNKFSTSGTGTITAITAA